MNVNEIKPKLINIFSKITCYKLHSRALKGTFLFFLKGNEPGVKLL